ncbi:scoloptoxin SSD14 isoform X2 [Tribolium castaneum]|uniref:scoloptoxin SSD14 isoform X2 n=1 Tax=Tribolium castaneum TaxID=7070 RepID=UPI00077DBD13|nr:PREDICTED: gamma-glutamyltranspeptidase 1 isoform X2 [Tribolium castaneum]|eukprot:XP_015838324.1 PREDICTED: gamma-glutamyltranspeptidase 1 isoform X2 [Tribolium castaneum]
MESEKTKLLDSQSLKDESGPRARKRCIIFIVIIIIIIACIAFAYHYGFLSSSKEEEELRPPNPEKALPPSASVLRRFKRAAVCADGATCAKIGRSILDQNGSAVDAAIATLFCNGIYTMQSMGLGGGFLMTIYIKDQNKAYTLNAREKAPLKATPDLYKDDQFISRKGALAIAVPGELRGYQAAHEKFGKLEWSKLVEPSIELCEKGYNMSKHQHESLKEARIVNDTNLKEWFFDSEGKFKKMGSTIVPKKLCETLRLIAKSGGHDLYNGTLSKMLVEDLEEIGSIITKEDLESYQAEWMDPIEVELRHHEKLYSVPPPGSGALLAFILSILDGFKFKPHDLEGVQNTVQTYHKIIEAFKYAYAKRTELGDTNFVHISDLLRNLTSHEYAESIRKEIQENSTSNDPKDYGAVFYSKEDHGTAHISVLAENGDAVSVTSSVNLYFGAGLTSRQTGIILNSVMDDFSFPNFQNYFNLPGSPNNELRPGKRPLSSMSPTILVDEHGDVKLVLGASGGTKITTSVALVIMRTLWFGQNIKEAIDAPRIHHQLYPMQVQYEYGTLQQVVTGLEALGHKTSRYTDAGSIICALYNTSGLIQANADHRKGGDVYGL